MKLILHIGAGKTGTSAVQGALKKHEAQLVRRGFLYTGLYFEQTPVYSPGELSPHQQFHSDLHDEDGTLARIVGDYLPRLFEHCRKNDIHTVIWSNESLFGIRAADQLLPVLLQLPTDVDLEVIAYIRRQDRWFASAYQQWGVKHKTNPGRIRTFDEWLQDWKSACDYQAVFAKWEEAVSERNIKVRIYEKTRDVVSDFFQLCRIDDSILKRNLSAGKAASGPANERLSATIASLYKLYNDNFQSPKLPTDFSPFLHRTGIDKLNLDQASARIDYPSKERLSGLMREYEAANASLKKYDSSDYKVEFPADLEVPDLQGEVSKDALISALLMALVNCEERIARLESTLPKR